MSRAVARSAALAIGLVSVFMAGLVPAMAAPTGPAAPTLHAYMKRTTIPCYTQAGEGSCTIAALDQGTCVFYGKPDGATELAVAFMDDQYDATGNGMDQMAIVLRASGGRWEVVGRADNTIGTAPRDVRFYARAITYVGTVLSPRDTRADPTGKGTFRLDIGERDVAFAGKAATALLLARESRR